MAHLINIDDGKASMMYAGDVPWHGLGTRLDKPATAAEAIAAANLDWEVTKLPLFGTNGQHGVRVGDKYITVRADKIGRPGCVPFGIVSEGYTPLQNREAFEFFDSIVQDKNAAIYHTAGALGNGERIWLLAKLPGHIRAVNDDISEKYLLLSNSHDGQAGVQIKFTPVRVVCNNTLTLALQGGDRIAIPHYRDVKERLEKATELLNLINDRYRKIEETFQKFAEVPMNIVRLDEYLARVFPVSQDAKETVRQKVEKDRRLARHFFDFGAGNSVEGVRNTLWAAYNGVTELIDHRIPNLKGAATERGLPRLNSIWFGIGATVKARAYKVAVEKLKEWRN